MLATAPKAQLPKASLVSVRPASEHAISIARGRALACASAKVGARFFQLETSAGGPYPPGVLRADARNAGRRTSGLRRHRA